MPRNIGIIDCGSNTVRLCIYRVNDLPDTPDRKLTKTLLNVKTMAGLASDISEGIMTERGIKRAANAITDHLKSASYFNCARIDIFATAFLRNCSNSLEAQRAIEKIIDAPIVLLSAADEAHLGYVGAHYTNPEATEGILMDLGGGSCELTRLSQGKDICGVSVSVGSLSSYANQVEGIIPSAAECHAIADEFYRATLRATQQVHEPARDVWAVGGSVRAVAKVLAEMTGEAKPTSISYESFTQVIDRAISDPHGFARLALKATPDRVHTIVPGCVIAREVLKLYQAQSIHICKGGVREGYLLERMLNIQEQTS